MASDSAQNGTRAVAVYACKPADLLEVVRITCPVESAVALDRSPYLEPLVAEAHEERWCVLLANRRNARFFVGDGGGPEETDRVEDDVHSQHDQGGWSQARYQRGVEKEKDDHLVYVAEVAFSACWASAGRPAAGRRARRAGHDLEQKLHPYLRERIVARLHPRRGEPLGRERARRGECCDRGLAAARRARCARPAGRGAARWTRRGGLAAVLQALNEQRVETLLVGETFRSAGGRDLETGMPYPGDHAARRSGARAVREHPRADDREGDRAVGACDQGALPRRSRPARRDRRGAALPMPAPERLITGRKPVFVSDDALAALAEVPRDRFVPPDLRAEAWENIPLPIGSGQTISQPLVVARMCELLELTGDDTVFDVGTGFGYHAALCGAARPSRVLDRGA